MMQLIRYMARDGLDEEEIQKKLNISKNKLTRLIKSDETLVREIEYAKMLTDYAVEDALLKKALGSTSVEVKETEKNSGSESVTITKEIPADTAALKFWLENRCPHRWSKEGVQDSESRENTQKILKGIDLLADKDRPEE